MKKQLLVIWNHTKKLWWIIWKPLKIILGTISILVGIPGLIIPSIPGIPLILLGLYFLGVIKKEDIKKWKDIIKFKMIELNKKLKEKFKCH